jgi:hypothetical protein
MGIDVNAIIVVGLPRHEYPDPDDLQNWLDDGEIEAVGAHVESDDDEEAICGIVVEATGSFSAMQLHQGAHADRIEEAFRDFQLATGFIGRLWLTPRMS